MTEAISAALRNISAPGAFATRLSAPANALSIEVDAVGELVFPLSKAKLAKLKARAQPSPFGLREQTLRDPSVRSSTEIAADALTIGEAWSATLAEKVDEIRAELGLAADCGLHAVLDKLLIYETGQFFKPHQDTERDDDMIASLVVVLPQEHTGGALSVQLGDERLRFAYTASAKKQLSLVAFYADCVHEVSAVKSGARLALQYQLRLGATRATPSLSFGASEIERLTKAVRAYFAEAEESKSASSQEQLVYLLDHEYTARGLAWNRLKNGDRVRVAALCQVAERLGLDAHLALTELHEVWSCEPTYDSYRDRRRGRGRYDDDEADESPSKDSADSAVLSELIDSDITFSRVLDAEGAAVSGGSLYAWDKQICVTRETDSFDPYKREHEGYMGNYGDTLERWYRRAALLLWPKSQAFARSVSAGPAKHLARLATSQTPRERRAAECAQIVKGCARVLDTGLDESARRNVLEIATLLDDRADAMSWLACVNPLIIDSDSVARAWIACVEAYGIAWARKVIGRWKTQQRSQWGWPRMLWARAGLDSAGAHARELASELLPMEVEALGARLGLDSWDARWMSLDVPSSPPSRISALLAIGLRLADARTLAVIEARWPADRMETLGVRWAIVRDAIEFDRGCVDGMARWSRVVELSRSLRAHAERPPRAADDWRIDLGALGDSDVDQRFAEFMRSNARHFEWPLAQDGRTRVEHLVQQRALPVTYETLKRGTPRVFVLTKSKDVAQREEASRRAAESALRSLERMLSPRPH